MPIDSSIRAEILAQLSALGASSPILRSPASIHKLYEVYVATCMMRALREKGAHLVPKDTHGVTTHDLRFRMAPGLIYSPASSPGYVLVSYEGQEFELHTDLRVLGKSGILHELDVCLIDRTQAQHCRGGNVDPPASSVAAFLEVKYHGVPIPLHEGREYLGLSSEFTIRPKAFVCNLDNSDIQILLASHKGTVHFGPTPLNPRSTQELVSWLGTEISHQLA